MKPYYQSGGITIYHGDCREILPTLSFAAIVCDPPYGLGVELSRRAETTICGDESTVVRDYVVSLPHPKLVFGSPAVPRPQCDAVLIWDKSELTGMGDLKFPWKRTHEEIYVIGVGWKSARRKGSVLRYPLRPSWANHPDSVSGLHPTEKPLSLMLDLLECCPWLEIADPCCGIGATLVAAKKLGKSAVGVELKERYCEIAANRLQQEVLDFNPSPHTPVANEGLVGTDELFK